MKEMIYNGKHHTGKEILDEGTYLEYKWMILSLHSHPCAYIFLDKEDEYCGVDYDKISHEIGLSVHGGLTFADTKLHRVLQYSDKYKCDTLQRLDGDWIIGWDYAHYGDLTVFGTTISIGKRWKTKEIRQEVKQVINQLDDCFKYRSLDKSRKEFIEELCYHIEEEGAYDCAKPQIDDEIDAMEYAHNLEMNGIRIEELDDYEYGLVENYVKSRLGYIQDYIDEAFCSYYGDPAFASSYDYWNYILG